MNDRECTCWQPPFVYTDFDSRFVGVDETAGRFAEVSVEQCKRCGQRWLRYFYENEAFSRSGRWYRVAISEAEAAAVTPTNAAEFLSRANWHFRGGSYFDTAGVRCDWRLEPEQL